MSPLRLAPPFAFVAALTLVGCANVDAVACRVGADCPSGVCRSDGVCIDAPSSSASSAASNASSASSSSASGSGGGGGGGSGGGAACMPNNDGMITAAEVPLRAGLHATFRAAENVPVDTAGSAQMDGSRTWDMTAMLSGDHAELVETQAIQGQWFAADFANATYAAKLSDASDLLGVFTVNASALTLDGVVSPMGGATKTELTYMPPVIVVQFPFQEGTTWSTNATVSGTADGVPAFYSEQYQSKVDAHGTLATPFSTFPVLRVNTSLVRTVGAVVTATRTFAFATECFGTIATTTSEPNDPTPEFTQAAELARLSP